MISGIGLRASQQMPIFLNSEASKFQGRIVSSFSNSLQTARIIAIAKCITLLAFIVLSVAATAILVKRRLSPGQTPGKGNLKNQGSGKLQNLSQPFNSLQTSFNVQNDPRSVPQKQTPISPFLLSPPKRDKKPLKTQATPSTSSITPVSLASTLPSLSTMTLSPIGPAKNFQVPLFSLQPFSLDPMKTKTFYKLFQKMPQNVIDLSFDKSSSSLTLHFQQAIRAIKSLEDQINLQAKTPFPNSISYDAFFLQSTDALGLFVQGDVHKYEQVANQLYEYLDSLMDFHFGPNSSSSTAQDPIRKAKIDIEKKDLSIIFAALSESQFNQGKAMDCFSSAKKIDFDSLMRDSILTILARNFISQGSFDDAIAVLDECSICNAREHLKLYLAKALFNQNNWDGKGLQVAAGMHLSKESNKFILNIAKLLFLKGDLIEAYSTSEKAFRSVERVQMFHAIAKAHFNSGDLDKAYDMAGELPSDEKKEIIHAIAKKYILDGKPDKAKDMAGELSGNEKTEILEACAL